MKTKRSSKPSAQNRLNSMYAEFGSWKLVAEYLSTEERKMDRGLLRRVAIGRQRAPNSVLLALGLPPRMEPAPVCPKHGVVHTAKRCPPDKPRVKRKRLTIYDLYVKAVEKNKQIDSQSE